MVPFILSAASDYMGMPIACLLQAIPAQPLLMTMSAMIGITVLTNHLGHTYNSSI